MRWPAFSCASVLLSTLAACSDPPASSDDETSTSTGSDTTTTSSETSTSTTESGSETGSETGGPPCDCPDDGNPCTEESCSESGECLHPSAPAGTPCRASSGECDPAEACDGATPSCPADAWDASCMCPEHGPLPGYVEHDGLRAIEATKFALLDTGEWADNLALLDGLGQPYLSPDELVLNRMGTPPSGALLTFMAGMIGYVDGFEWEAGDQTVSYWIPQGLSAGATELHEWVIVSWHYDEGNIVDDPNPPASGDKGVRVSFAAVEDLANGAPYRHVLLVEPDAQAGLDSVDIHAGGLALVGPFLYVADTTRGIRVFDVSRIIATSTAPECDAAIGWQANELCAYGYAYALPQVGAHFYPAELPSACKPSVSYLSFDQTSQPPSLISGEYDNDATLGIYSRLLRFPLDDSTDQPQLPVAAVVRASEAWYAGNRNLQGAVSIDGKFLLDATRYSGALFTGMVDQPSTVYRASNAEWAWMPEGIHHDPDSERLYVNTEGHVDMPRVVFVADATQIP